MTDAANSPRRNWLPRFSLLTLLLVTTIVALSLALVRAWHRVESSHHLYLRTSEVLSEKERLLEMTRLQLANAKNPNSDLLQAKLFTTPEELSTTEPLIWKWWVWIPPGRTYDVCLATGDDVDSNSPIGFWDPLRTTTRFGPIYAGGKLIGLQVQYNRDLGRWEKNLLDYGDRVGAGAVSDATWGKSRAIVTGSDRNGDPSESFFIGGLEVQHGGRRADAAILWLEPRPLDDDEQ